MMSLFKKITSKNTAKAMLMSFMLLSIVENVQATTIINGIEIASGLGTIPSDIAGHYHDLNGNKKTAAFYHLVTDIISIFNKGCFFGNNIKDQGMDGFKNGDRDSVINVAWLARDLTRAYQHLQQYWTLEDVVEIIQQDAVQEQITAIEDEALLLFDEESMPEEQLKPEEVSRLAYFCQVLVIPSLRGLTACLLAWSHDKSSDDLNSVQGRFLATSVHSLVRLSQEYAELDSDSSYTKMLVGIALIANTVWLYKEWQNYQGYIISDQALNDRGERRERRINRRVEELLAMRQEISEDEQVGECIICAEENRRLVQLSCGHADTCRGCLRESIIADLDKMDKNDLPRCPHMGDTGRCGAAVFTDVDVRNIVGDDRPLLRRFVLLQMPREKSNQQYCGKCFLRHSASTACADAKMVASLDEIAIANEMISADAKKCPNQKCGIPIIRLDGCNHMECKHCNHGFCWQCLAHIPEHVYEKRGNGIEYQPCGCILFSPGTY